MERARLRRTSRRGGCSRRADRPPVRHNSVSSTLPAGSWNATSSTARPPLTKILSRHERRLSVMQRHAKADDLFWLSANSPRCSLMSWSGDGAASLVQSRPGFVDLDRDLGGGLWAGQLVILAARTSVGKTALSWQIAVNAAERSGRPALFASAEMPPIELIEREFSRQSRVDSNVLRNGQLSQDESKGCGWRVSMA